MSSPYADFPEVDVTDPTTVDAYGADTMSEICKILNGKILGSRRPHIKSPWLWQSPFTLEAQLTPPDPDTGDYALATGQVNIYPDPTTGRLVVQKSTGEVVELENIITVLQDLTNVAITSVANGDSLRYNSTTSKWENQPFPSGIGEANTASNVGTAGIGVWKQKTGVNLEFKKIFPNSSKITVTDDTGNSRISLDVVESALTIANLGGNLTVPRGGTGLSTITSGSYLKGAGTSNVALQAAPIPVADGGTGATTLTGMLKGNGTGAVTALAQVPVASGGTGAATITGILRGNGTSPVTAIGLGSNGDVLTNVSGTPTFQAPAGGGGGGGVGSNPAIGPKIGQLQAGGGPVAVGSVLGSGLCSGWQTAALTSGNVSTDLDADGQFIALNSSSSTSQTNSEINSVLATIFRTDLNPKIWLKIKFPVSIVNTRSFIGFTDLIALPQNQSVFIQSHNGFGWNWDTSNLANIQLVTNNANATVNLVDTGVSPVLNTAMNIKIEVISSSSTAQLTIDGTPFATTVKVPASSAKLGFLCRMQNTAASTRTMNVYYMYCEQDK